MLISVKILLIWGSLNTLRIVYTLIHYTYLSENSFIIQRNFKKQSYISRYLYWLLELHITFIFIDLGLHSRRSWIYVIYSRYVWITPIYHLLYRDVLNFNYFKMSKNVWKICKWFKLRIFILLKMGLVCSRGKFFLAIWWS